MNTTHGDYSEFTTTPIDAVFASLTSSPQGLTHAQAVERIHQYGENSLPQNKTTAIKIFVRQLTSPFIYLLLGAGILTFILKQHTDSLFILLFVSINTVLGFYQEFKSEKTAELLKNLSAPMARVLRNGNVEKIATKELVPGDIVYLYPGDIIPADARLFETENLVIDESVITGESISVTKTTSFHKDSPSSTLLYASTKVIKGTGIAVVIKTGKDSMLGAISNLTGDIKKKSEFEANIARFSTVILKVIVWTLVVFYIFNLFIKGNAADPIGLLLFSIALAVSVIPEALPVVTVFSLSRGARHLAKNNVIVKRLTAIEGLGAIEVLCTDKTGTLTENKLSIKQIYSENESLCREYAFLSTRQDNPAHYATDAIDTALMKSVDKKSRIKLNSIAITNRAEFDPHKKYSSITVIFPKKITILRGAPETLMSLCLLSKDKRHKYESLIKELGMNGLRSLAICTTTDGKSYHFDGIIALNDPLKTTTEETIKEASRLGVAIKIITGDSPAVAGYVAKAVGLIENTEDVITGDEFDALTHKNKLLAVDKQCVFARVNPVQKYAIIETLKEHHEVGFLGEGINDAPALKSAHVGIVVQSASDISRDAADIILLNKSLKSIVIGIKEGRQVSANISKYIKATLASNFGNFYAVAVSTLFIPYLPMLPVQILLVNLLSDFPMIAIATDTVSDSELATPQKINIHEILRVAFILGIVSTTFDFIFFAIYSPSGPATLQTMWFIGSIITELLFLFSIRTKTSIFKAQFPPITIISLTGIAALITIGIPLSPFGALFSFIHPSGMQLTVVGIVIVAYVVTTEIAKHYVYKLSNTTESYSLKLRSNIIKN